MTTPLKTSAHIRIDRSPEEVWAVVSDYAADRRWRKGIREMTPDVAGAPRVGTNVREVLRLGGKDYVTDTTVTETGPGLSYRFAGAGTSGDVRGGRSVVAADGGAVFTYDVEVVPHRLPRPLRPIAARLFVHGMRRDLRRLRSLVEAR